MTELSEGPASPAPASSGTPPRRWTHHLPTGIALAALLLSVSTTFIDLQRSKDQERHAAGLELTDLVQRLVALPRQYAEAARAPNADKAALIPGFGQEKSALAARATEILARYPGIASGEEYEVVAEARVTDINGDVVHLGGVDRSIAILREAVTRSDDAEGRASLLARAGGIAFRANDFPLARELYKESVLTVAKSPKLLHTASYYEALWGQWEASRGQCESAAAHLQPARDYLRDSGGSSGASDAIEDLASRLSRCSSTAAAGNAPARAAGSSG